MPTMTDHELMATALRYYANRLKEQRDMKQYMIKNRKWFEKTDEEVAALKGEVAELDGTMERCRQLAMKM